VIGQSEENKGNPMEAATQTAAQQGGSEPKLKIDKFAEGAVTCLKFTGTIDEQFDGKKLAGSLKGGTLVLDLKDISKISSFGIREWVDFITSVGQRVEHIVLVECAPKVVDQLNMVANFAGKGRVFSFYAPYRCDYCDADSRVLLQIDRDYDAIKSMKPPERPCGSCGNPEYFDEDPTSFFSYLAAQAKFELDPTVANFLASKLDYQVSDAARRLRVEKHVEGRSVYLKVGGDLDGTFPREKLAEGMEGTVVLDVASVGKIDPAGAAEWRGFMAMITPPSERIFLLGCPPVFLERLTRPEDLGPKAQVMSFAMPYSCSKCATTASQSIDVEQHFDVLKFATPPEMKCPDCGGPTSCSASEGLLSHLTSLAKPQVEGGLRKFIKEIQERKPERPQVATTVAEAAAAGRRSSFLTVLLAAAMAAIVALAVVVYFNYQKQQEAEKIRRARDAVGALKAKSGDARPAWIEGDARFSATCRESGGGYACVAVSSYTDTKEDATGEARDAALEAFTNALDQKIGNSPLFAQEVRKIYGDNRQKALSDLETARTDPDGTGWDSAKRKVREGRQGVAKALRKTAGTFLPAAPAGEYWEEYAPLVGTGSRFLVFVKYEFSPQAAKQLAELYSTAQEGEGAKVVTLFPAVAWRFPDMIDGGAGIVAIDPNKVMGRMGLQAQYIVLTVNGRKIKDAGDFVATIKSEVETLKQKQGGGDVKIEIKRDDSGTTLYSSRIEGESVVNSGQQLIRRPGGSSGGRPGPGGGGMNVWGQTGGGRDNPND
jgi:anti-anti-sigma regulatory factor